jgi:hypothetical protein
MRSEIEGAHSLRVAFGARCAEIVCRSDKTNESLVAWEAATRPRSTRNRKSVKLNGCLS